MVTDDRHEDRLRALLDAGDPAADGAELSGEESANLRREVLRSVRTARPVRWLPIGATVAAATLALVLLVPRKLSTPIPKAVEAVGQAEIPGAPSPEAPRQIRFATEQGTQIIWVLDPALDL